MTPDPLVPGTERWDACKADVMALLLGRIDRADGKARYSLRQNTARHPLLNAEIRAAVQAAAPGREWADNDTWELLTSVLDSAPDSAPVDASDEAKLLFGARVLMNRVDAPDESAVLPGAVDGVTLAQLRETKDVAPNAGFKTAITVRKAYLTRLLGAESVGVFEWGAPRMRRMAEVVLFAMLASILDATADTPVLPRAEPRAVESGDLIGRAKRIIESVGLTPSDTVAGVGERLQLLSEIRDVLDRFGPSVFQSSLDQVAWQLNDDEANRALSLRGRKRLMDRLREHVRPGVHVDNLPQAIMRTQVLRSQWLVLAKPNAVPAVPAGLSDVVDLWRSAGCPLPRAD